MKKGFTLAEVLITLAIIGVVAAMTIPTLIAKINSIVTDNQQKVFNAKLIKGMNLTKTAGDLNNTYTSTYDFLVNGLGKNLKMAKVCDKDHIRDCIPYDKIKYEDITKKEKTINVFDIKTADKLNLEEPFTDIAAFVLADGTPVIVSYNLKCIDDPDKADTTINACLAGIYDLNGSRKPNKYLAKVETINNKDVTTEIGDLHGFNGAYIGNSCLGDVCLASTAIIADENMLSLVNAVDPNYTSIPKNKPDLNGQISTNYTQLAKDYCEKVLGAHIATSNDLTEIARILYDDNSINGSKSNLTMVNKDVVYTALGIDSTKKSFTIMLYGTDPMWMSAREYNKNSTDIVGTAYHSSLAVCVK